MYTLNSKGKLIILDRPMVMGIVNLTPDSFFENSRAQNVDEILRLSEKMISEGADILDLGGQSTRPGSQRISVEEELKRVVPAIEAARLSFPEMIFSVDTFHSRVAKEAVAAGADIVNDISSGNMDHMILETVASLRVPYICMHMKGSPENMQIDPSYKNVTTEVFDFLGAKIQQCIRAGIKDIIIDPGFGFGKKIDHNFKLLRELPLFKLLERPVVAGLSRKSTIYKTLGISASEALNGTTVLNTMALMNGASILRVHDVLQAREAVVLYQNYVGEETGFE